MIRTLSSRAPRKHAYQLAALLILVLGPLFALSKTAYADTITLTQARACYDQLNGKETLQSPMTDAVCSQVCVADGTVWACINPNAAALTPTQLSNTVLDAKRLYGTSVGAAICDQTVEQERASCVDYSKTVVIDCINAWVASLSSSQLKDFIITNINVDNVATCAANKLNAPKTVVASALNDAKSQIDNTVDQAVADAEKKAEQACKEKNMTYSPDDSNADADGCVKNTPNVLCSGGALGWLLCPVVSLLNDVNQFMAGQIEGLLRLNTMTLDTSRKAIEAVWATVVGIANLALVVAFLIVIFSQATSIGLSAYGIKKMLPRIIAAAILLNLSFFICSILIDIANVIGASIQGIFQAAVNSLGKLPGSVPDAGAAGHVLMDMGGLLAILTSAVAVTAVAFTVGALPFIVPVLIAGTFAIVIFFLALALRQVLVALLVIIAPLAFVAMVLPNTESLFKKWWSSLVKLLVMYPAIAIIMYGSVFVGQVMLSQISEETANNSFWTTAGLTLATGPGGVAGALTQGDALKIILAYAVIALGPPIGSYMYLKSANKIIASVTGAVSKVGKGLTKATTGWAKKEYKRGEFATARDTARTVRDRDAKIAALQSMGSAEEWKGGRFNPFNKQQRTGVLRRAARAGLFMNQQAQQKLSSAYVNAEDTVYKEEVEDEEKRLAKSLPNNITAAEQHLRDLGDRRNASASEVHAAMNHLAGYAGGKSTMRSIMRDQKFMAGIKASRDGHYGGSIGLQKGWAANSKFGKAHPDVEANMEADPEKFIDEVAAGRGDATLGGNFKGLTSLTGATAAGGTTPMTGPPRDWAWHAALASRFLPLGEAHTGQLYDKITYDTALTASEAPNFNESDPDIQAMVRDIIAKGKEDARYKGLAEPDGNFALPSSYRPAPTPTKPTGWWRDPSKPY